MSRRVAVLAALPIAAALSGLAMVRWAAPHYASQGFPLDDAWIHAVYARELARSGMLAYNPGVAATGETSPLWALILAIPHRFAADSGVVLATKLTGFLLHVAAAVVVSLVLRLSADERDLLPWLAGALVAFHPDLVAASISGMEVPLAELVIAALAFAVVDNRPGLAVACGAAAALARPETPVFAVFALGYWGRTSPRRALTLFLSAVGGAIAAMAAMAARNLWVSGRPLPATFYAKANVASPIDLAWQEIGFSRLLGTLTLVNQPALLIVLFACAVVLAIRPATTAGGRAAVALFLSGIVFCAISFALIRPIDPPAFYHQRYVLPALLPMVAALPLLVRELLARLNARWSIALQGAVQGAVLVVVVVLAALLIQAAPARYRRLSNDARNIDDVQVAFGRALGVAQPSDVAWVVDAGAPRYFGNAFIVDMIGLNTFEMLTPGAQSYLDAHPPRYLDAFPGWSEVEGHGGSPMFELPFTTTTAYTVTSSSAMRRHTLVTCLPPGRSGRMTVHGRAYGFRCAGGR